MKNFLFDDKDEIELTPVPDRLFPVVWIEKLIIVESLVKNAHILREIHFRRGINIIMTEQPKHDATNSVGHDVGKTLMTRFIRYLLGEQTFGTATTRNIISQKYPNGYVIGKIYIHDVSWIVARPLIANSQTSSSFAFQSEDWADVLTDHARSKYTEFLKCLSDTALSNFSDISLPDSGKSFRWLDMLAWLTRDQACGLRSYTNWRASETESGTANLSVKDANYLIRMVMNILDDEENNEIVIRNKLLKSRKRLALENNLIQLKLDTVREYIKAELVEDNIVDDKDGILFHESSKNSLTNKICSLQRLLKDEEEAPPSDEENTYIEIVGQLGELKGKLQYKELEKKRNELLLEQENNASSQNRFEVLAKICMNPDCPLQQNIDSIEDQQKDERISNIKQEIERIKKEIDSVTIEITTKTSIKDKCFINANEAKKEKQNTINGIIKKISYNELLRQQLCNYEIWLSDMKNNQDQLSLFELQIKESDERLKTKRSEYDTRLKQIVQIFEYVASKTLNTKTQYRISVDGYGLRISPKNVIAGSGQATLSGMVLSLDWTACLESICGYGYFPRFLIHDSPREADREQEAYKRLFTFVVEVEKLFGTREPSFQYIITTTTPPPDKIATQHFVRAILHSRTPDGLLLGFDFTT